MQRGTHHLMSDVLKALVDSATYIPGVAPVDDLKGVFDDPPFLDRRGQEKNLDRPAYKSSQGEAGRGRQVGKDAAESFPCYIQSTPASLIPGRHA